MIEVGEYLRQVRERLGLTIYDVEKETKILSRYITMMEEGNFEGLPGHAYAIGFLRSYAKYLGVESDELVKVYKEKYPNEEANLITIPPEESSSALAEANHVPLKPWKVFAIVAIIIVAAGAGLLYYLGTEKDRGTAQNNPPVVNGDNTQQPNTQEPTTGEPTTQTPDMQEPTAQEPTTQTPAGQEPSQGTGTAEDQLKVEVNAVYANCWIGVTVDGKYSDTTLAKGGTATFTAQESVKIKFGSAGAVEVTVDGVKQASLGGIGDVLTKEYLRSSSQTQ